ncbi:cell wall-binding repeat-containing protein [uncultured Clostridium sp.]|uniref:cell wall-binding repeat-containing protein n=1 Tax=uncultured Clostridium sp. TaxID=59620 RepID=UPI003217BE1F
MIPQVTLDKLNKANTVYIVGGNTVISKDIENKLINMGKKVIRLGGQRRFDASIVVANEIEKVKGIQEIYYVNGLKGEADAMSIAPLAASKGNPVILTDGKSTNIEKVYGPTL